MRSTCLPHRKESLTHRGRGQIFRMLVILLAAGSQAAAQIELVGHLEPSLTTSYGDVWGEGNYAYLGTRGNQGVFIIDISNPAQPFVASQYFPSAGEAPQDVKVQDGIGYFSMNSGATVDIVDLSDPTQPTLLANISDTGSHNVFIDNHLLYTTSSNRTTRVYDVSDPTNPILWHNFDEGVHDMTAIGDRVYTSSFSDGTRIYDISNMTQTSPPVELGRVLTGSSTHSSWSTPDGTVLINAREQSGGDVGLFDIADVTDPSVLARIQANDFSETLGSELPHNPLLVGDTLYASWYQTGLQVFDVAEPSRPIHLGRFDTISNWGVYPFLGPDRVLLSDINSGLFIVDATDVLDSPQSDFNEDGAIDVEDIDLLVEAVSNGSTDLRFDLNTDSLVNMNDVDDWRAIAGAANLAYNAVFRVQPYRPGDANLDGNVDGLDFIRWNANKFQAVTGWSNGDFNADGVVDGLDFAIWNAFKFQSSNPGAAVPEPTAWVWLVLVVGILGQRRRM